MAYVRMFFPLKLSGKQVPNPSAIPEMVSKIPLFHVLEEFGRGQAWGIWISAV